MTGPCPATGKATCIIGEERPVAVGTLVERTTRYVLLLHLPDGTGRRPASTLPMRRAITTLPGELRRTITWDQGKEMAEHASFTIDTGIPVYFCDPHSPWQRGSQREHQRAAAPVLAQGHRPVALTASRPRRHRPQPQQPAPQDDSNS